MQKLKNALEYLNKIKSVIARSEKVFLFLDYDGTLTEIKNKPEYAKPSKKLTGLINTINSSKFIISIISGRQLKDLKKILYNINLTKINLIGSHGAEIKFAGENNIIYQYDNNLLRDNDIIKNLKKKILKFAAKIENSMIEEKPFSFAFHYRNSPIKEKTKINELIDYLREQEKIYKFRYLEMKKVIEVMPAGINKGSVISKILKKYNESSRKIKNAFTICIGDDVSDEDLFTANRTGINIKVSKQPNLTKTAATYYLKSPREVLSFLEKIAFEK